MAFSIGAPRKKGSGKVHSAHSVFTRMNVLIFRRTLEHPST